MHQAYQIAVGPVYQPEKLVRDPLYKKWVRRFPCIGCGTTWGIDPAHTGAHGLSTKSSDLSCLPLCRRKCHREFDANPQAFAERHQIDIPNLIAQFHALWAERRNS